MISGCHIGMEDLTITHLQSAGDTWLYCNAAEREMEKLKALLGRFEAVSSLMMNMGKGMMVVSGASLQRTTNLAAVSILR